MANQVLAGAEPASLPGGPHGALVLHGITGTPQSMRGLATALAAAGFTVELPLLPGHGTAIEDLEPTRFADWLKAAEGVYADLAGRVDDVIVVGLSMGGTLAAELAANHPEILGAVFINPFIGEPPADMLALMRGMVDAGETRMPGIGSDIADPDSTELAYTGTPLLPLLSLIEAVDGLPERLAAVHCPILVFTSPEDHVVPPASSDVLAASVAGPVERITLARSYHVATLDYDKDEIEQKTVAFARRLTTP